MPAFAMAAATAATAPSHTGVDAGGNFDAARGIESIRTGIFGDIRT